MPILVGVPFGVAPVVLPPLPLPTKVTVDFLEPLDWSGDGPDSADDPDLVEKRFDASGPTWTVEDLDGALGTYFADRDPAQGFTAAEFYALS